MVASDSETAFLRFENHFLMICFCLFFIFFLSVCLFILIYPTGCLCDVITRLFLPSLIKQWCIKIVCLFPKLCLEKRFRLMDAKSGLVILMS